MNIVIQLSEAVPASAEARVRMAAKATEQHDINFNGDTIAVERGDFTCLAGDDGHPDAGALFSLVQSVIAGGEFEVDEGCLLVPFCEGGVAKIPLSQVG